MKFDKNTLIGLLLILGIVIGFSIWQAPSKEERLKMIAQRDSIAKAQEIQRQIDSTMNAQLAATGVKSTEDLAIVNQLEKDSTFALLDEEAKAAKIDSVKRAKLSETYGGFGSQTVGTEKTVTVESELATYTFSNKGGILKSVVLKDFKKYSSNKEAADLVELYQSELSNINLPIVLPNGQVFNTKDAYFEIEAQDADLKGNASTTVSMKLYAGSSNKYIEFLYIITGNDYMTDFRINLVDIGSEIKKGSDLKLEWYQSVASLEKDAKIENTKSTVFFAKGSKVDDIGFGKSESEEIEKPLKWIGFSQQFFTTTLISDAEFTGKILLESNMVENSSDNTIRTFYAAIPLNYAGVGNESFKMHFYAGPKDYKILKKYDLELEEQINLGWKAFRWINTLFIINIFQWLDSYNLNYGIIILILTLMVKILLSPITYKTFLSSAKMRALKPDIDELNEKMKDEDPMKKQQALMGLYNKAGVNPLAGCIPALLQMPILFALFTFFPASIELRGQSFLWADDLSSWDSIYIFPNGFSIPLYGGHISLFAILMTVTTVLYTRMSQNTSAMSGPQATQMKIMMYVMPVMFLVFLNSYSAALSYYYFLANAINILLTMLFRYVVIDEKKLREQIEINKARPDSKKKGGFAAKLEEMQKIQQQRAEELKKKKK